ncbi:MAG: NUDIX domain-containing protein [Halioglobus sp.]
MAFELRYGPDDVRVLEDNRVWEGHYAMRRLKLQHRRFDGEWSDPILREVFERGDAVGVLPYNPKDDSLVLIEQVRPGAIRANESPWMLELIAGVVEEGESDIDVVHREAMEEAACTLSALEPIATVFPSAGACSEQVRLFCGCVETASIGGMHGLAEEGEDILVHSISRVDAMRLLAENRIPNGHTLIGLLWLQHHGDALRERWR